MVYTVSVRNLSFKQDLSDIMSMLADQQATYAILKYAYDVPLNLRNYALETLFDYINGIIHKKLLGLIVDYINTLEVPYLDDEDVDKLEIDLNKVMANGSTNTLKLTQL